MLRPTKGMGTFSAAVARLLRFRVRRATAAERGRLTGPHDQFAELDAQNYKHGNRPPGGVFSISVISQAHTVALVCWPEASSLGVFSLPVGFCCLPLRYQSGISCASLVSRNVDESDRERHLAPVTT